MELYQPSAVPVSSDIQNSIDAGRNRVTILEQEVRRLKGVIGTLEYQVMLENEKIVANRDVMDELNDNVLNSKAALGELKKEISEGNDELNQIHIDSKELSSAADNMLRSAELTGMDLDVREQALDAKEDVLGERELKLTEREKVVSSKEDKIKVFVAGL